MKKWTIHQKDIIINVYMSDTELQPSRRKFERIIGKKRFFFKLPTMINTYLIVIEIMARQKNQLWTQM